MGRPITFCLLLGLTCLFIETTQSERCRDRIECSWVVGRGLCRSNTQIYRRIKALCMKSCGFCKPSRRPSAKDCRDLHRSCRYYQGRGYCRRPNSFMRTYCKQSCGLCQRQACFDDNLNCPYWSRIGQCRANPSYMLKKCRKSCKVCGKKKPRTSPRPSTRPVIINRRNVARGRPTKQSSTNFLGVSYRAVDGNRNPDFFSKSCTHTAYQRQPWWMVDLGNPTYKVESVQITNRGDCCWTRLQHIDIRVGSVANNPSSNRRCTYYGGQFRQKETRRLKCDTPVVGRYVYVQLKGRGYLTLCEVEVYLQTPGIKTTPKVVPETTPTPTEKPETPPIPTEEPETPPIPTEQPETPPIPTEQPETPPIPTEQPETPPIPTEQPETPPIPTDKPKTSLVSTPEPETPPIPPVKPETPPIPPVKPETTPMPPVKPETPPIPPVKPETPPIPPVKPETPPIPPVKPETPPIPTEQPETPPIPPVKPETPPIPPIQPETPPIPKVKIYTPPIPPVKPETPPIPDGKTDSPKLVTKPPPLPSSKTTATSSLPSPLTIPPQSALINSATCGLPSRNVIVGGNVTVRGQWPWMVAVAKVDSANKIWCGATLLSDRWALSAAHCFRKPDRYDATRYVLRIGEHDMENDGDDVVVKIKKIILHEKFNKATFDYDVALLRLEKPVTLSRLIRPTCIPKNNNNYKPGAKCIVAGWGYNKERRGSLPNLLHAVEVPIVETGKCKDSFRLLRKEVTSQMMCAGHVEGGKDSCQGDSGGPLMCRPADGGRWEQVGIVSWGVGCARENIYGVYTEVVKFQEWIDSHMSPFILP